MKPDMKPSELNAIPITFDYEPVGIAVRSTNEQLQEARKRIDARLDELQIEDHTKRMFLDLAHEEALVNAMKHGNWENIVEAVPQEFLDREITIHIESGFTEEEFSFKRRKADANGKEITIRKEGQNYLIRVSIQDRGKGFDPQSVPDPRENGHLETEGGRGLLLMRHAYDHVDISMNEIGTRVRMVLAERRERNGQ